MKNLRLKRINIFTIILFTLIAQSIFSQVSDIKNPVKWTFSSEKISDNTYKFNFKASIDDTWHLYSHDLNEGGPISTSINFDKSAPIVSKEKITTSKKPREKFDNLFGMNIRDFDKEVTFSQIVTFEGDGKTKISGYVEYMVCDDNMCLPPNEEDFSFTLNLVKLQTNTTNQTKNVEKISINNTKNKENIEEIIDTTNESNIATNNDIEIAESQAKESIIYNPNDISNKTLWWLFGFSFIAGLLAILTPCVFPMIPMTVSFFMSDGKSNNKLKAIVFGLSIIAIYTIIGTIVAIFLGANFANWLSTHWLPNVLFFLIFVFFAASFLGMFEITLPSSWVNKMDKNADKGGLVGSFFMAFTLVLVSFSCTGPLVGAILVQSAGGAVLEPIVGMLGFSLAFALPFSFFAFFPSILKDLPKSGGWLNSVKVVLGFLELALGLKFLSIADQTYHWGILDREIYLALWIVIFTLMGFYLLGKLKFSHDSDLKFISVPRLTLAIITFSFVVYLVPGMFGAPLKALAGYLPPQSTHDFDLNQVVRDYSSGAINSNQSNSTCERSKHADFLHLPHGLDGYFDYEQGLECAKRQNKPVFLVFTGHGCVNCREMEATVWSKPEVLERLKNNFVIIALYVDDRKQLPESDWVISDYDGKTKNTIGKINADFQISRYKVNAQPYYVIIDTNEKMLLSPMSYDLNTDNFIKFLDEGKSKFMKP